MTKVNSSQRLVSPAVARSLESQAADRLADERKPAIDASRALVGDCLLAGAALGVTLDDSDVVLVASNRTAVRHTTRSTVHGHTSQPARPWPYIRCSHPTQTIRFWYRPPRGPTRTEEEVTAVETRVRCLALIHVAITQLLSDPLQGSASIRLLQGALGEEDLVAHLFDLSVNQALEHRRLERI